jgi:glycosyltransferase involved in cell wall biosynthesis
MIGRGRKAAAGRATLPAPLFHGVVPAHGRTVCIVTSHAYGKYLRDCLDSLFRQTAPFEAVLLVDDNSTDETAAIAREYAERGLLYHRGKYGTPSASRNAGLAVAPWSNFVLFMDADNWLPPDFHERTRAAMDDPRIGAVCTQLDNVDEHRNALGRSSFPEPTYSALRRRNCFDTCSLLRREAVDQLGGWCTAPDVTLEDWALSLDMTRHGWNIKRLNDLAFSYRVHEDSRTATSRGCRFESGTATMREAMRTAIVTLFSGRAWMLERYAAALRALEWNPATLHLVALDNSADPSFHEALRAALDTTGLTYTLVQDDSQVREGVPATTMADAPEHRFTQGHQINQHLARLYALARQHLPAACDLVWTVECDIAPPADTLAHLARGLFFKPEAAAVTSCVRSRFPPSGLVAWKHEGGEGWEAGTIQEPPPLGEYEEIDSSGFHCTLWRREAFEEITFRPSYYWCDAYSSYDWAAYRDLRARGWKVFLSGSARVPHWQASGEALLP